MKATKWKSYSLALIAGMSVLTACSSDDNNDNGGCLLYTSDAADE